MSIPEIPVGTAIVVAAVLAAAAWCWTSPRYVVTPSGATNRMMVEDRRTGALYSVVNADAAEVTLP